MITFAPTFIKRFVKKVPFVTQMEIIFPPIYDDLEKRASRKLAQLISGNHSVNYGYGTLLRDSDRIITLCPAHSENFISLYPQLENKMEIIPPPPLLKMVQPGNGYNKANVRRKLGVVGGEFLIAFFGYADHNKGIDTLFKAFKQIRSANQRVRLLMIGGGIGVAKVNQVQKKAKVIDYENMLLSLPSELGIKDAVIWPGGYSWDSEDASELLWASDICVLPFIEGATMSRSSLSAAMAHRLPVITTLTERVEAPLVHKENVYLIPPKDPSVLSDAVLELMGDENLRNRLIAGAERLAAKWFSWNGAIEKTLRCLNLN
jgi:glycosyltransferase involved in cell wall biosynthesis